MLCTATPPEKAEQTKQEVFALLGWGENASANTAKAACRSCGKKEGEDTKLNKCGKKYYCSALCEKWNEEHGSSD